MDSTNFLNSHHQQKAEAAQVVGQGTTKPLGSRKLSGAVLPPLNEFGKWVSHAQAAARHGGVVGL